MSQLDSAINWFEIPATDFERAVRFYSDILGYELQTTEAGHARMGFFRHRQGNGIGGTIVCGEGRDPSRDGVRIYLNAGDNLGVALERVPAAGGAIITGKTLIAPGIGYLAVIDDTEGNRVCLHSMN